MPKRQTPAAALPRTVLVSYANGPARSFYLNADVRGTGRSSVLVHLLSTQPLRHNAEYYLLFRSTELAREALLQGYTLTEEDYWRRKFEEARQLGDRAVELPGGQLAYMPAREDRAEEPRLVDVERGRTTVRILQAPPNAQSRVKRPMRKRVN